MTDVPQPEIVELGPADGVVELGATEVLSAPTPPPALPPSPVATKPSVNFGPGVELLMNDKRKADKSPKPNAEMQEVDGIDKELDALQPTKATSKSGLFSQALFGSPSPQPLAAAAAETSGKETERPGSVPAIAIAKATAAEVKPKTSDDRTWDGFAPFGRVPVDPDNAPAPAPRSAEETLRLKFKVLRDLERLEKKGVHISKQYSMESSLEEMQGEFETIVAERERKASAKFQGRMLMAAVTGLEFLNNRFDPFDVKLDGWAEQIGENLEEYDEIFGELHEKYKSKAKMAPELKLLFQLGGSAIMVHMTNSMFKSAVPGMDDIMRQNPELMQQFSQAAVSSMGSTSPGFANFMQDFGGAGPPPARRPPQTNMAHGAPPAPMRTQVPRSTRPEPFSRPDLSAAQGGIDVEDNRAPAGDPRPEMKGPRDIGSILSGLKTQRIPGAAPPAGNQDAGSGINSFLSGLKTQRIPVPAPPSGDQEPSSTISVKELKEMSAAKAPPRSKRRGASARNTVSLEL